MKRFVSMIICLLAAVCIPRPATAAGPTITITLQPSDTYDGSGPFAVRATIVDSAKGAPSKTGVTADTLFYARDAGAWAFSVGSPQGGDVYEFAIPGSIPAGTLVEYFIAAWDDAGARSISPAGAPVNGYRFRVLDPLPPTSLSATGGRDMNVPLSWCPPAESLNYCTVPMWYLTGMPVAIFSTRFTPMHYPCRLEQAVSLWVDDVGMNDVVLHVYADDGTGRPDEGHELMTPLTVAPPAYPYLTVVDLSGYNIVISSGDFHIGWETTVAGRPAPCYDDTSPSTIRSLYRYAGLWLDDLDASWNHTAFVTYPADAKGGLVLPGARVPPSQNAPGNVSQMLQRRQAKLNTASPLKYFNIDGALSLAKGVSGYRVLRGIAPGGPYAQIGISDTTVYTDNAAINDSTYYYAVRAAYRSPDSVSANSGEASATPRALDILLVDDDGSDGSSLPDCRPVYTAALDSAGYAGRYTVRAIPCGATDGPDSAWYRGRDAVIWFTGANLSPGYTLTAVDEARLASHLQTGGRLLLSAQDYIGDRYPAAGQLSPGQFPYDYLGIDSVGQDFVPGQQFNIDGTAGTFTDGFQHRVPSLLFPNYPDNLSRRVLGGTRDLFTASVKAGWVPAAWYDSGQWKAVFFAMAFENIQDRSGDTTKGHLMRDALDWLINAPLPAELCQFSAAASEMSNEVAISWSTASENNTQSWIIERSMNPETAYQTITTLPATGSSVQRADYSHIDRDLQPGDYFYRLVKLELDGGRSRFGPVKASIEKPQAFVLAPAQPNPFSQSTMINYQLPAAGRVSLKVYNAAGQLVRTLADGMQPAGYHQAQWNGRNDAGQRLAAGIYLCRLYADGFTAINKVMIVR